MGYNTKQKDAVLHYIQGQHNRYVTAAELMAYFKGQRMQVGLTTIYRHLERLVQEGVVRKYNIEGAGGAKFKAAEAQSGFLLKCERCGDLVKFNCPDLENLSRHFHAEHNFMVDMEKTVFYGRCSKCREV